MLGLVLFVGGCFVHEAESNRNKEWKFEDLRKTKKEEKTCAVWTCFQKCWYWDVLMYSRTKTLCHKYSDIPSNLIFLSVVHSHSQGSESSEWFTNKNKKIETHFNNFNRKKGNNQFFSQLTDCDHVICYALYDVRRKDVLFIHSFTAHNTVKAQCTEKGAETVSLPASYLLSMPVRMRELFPRLASVSLNWEDKDSAK